MSAVLSSCGLYRHRLDRDVQAEGLVAALFGVNPSTAGATVNDATIRKDIGFAKVHGWRRIIKGNVFDYRATDVKALRTVMYPVSKENFAYLEQIAAEADILVPCWGDRAKVPRTLHHHIDKTLAFLRAQGKPMYCFGRTAGGDPRHPLMLGYDTPLEEYTP